MYVIEANFGWYLPNDLLLYVPCFSETFVTLAYLFLFCRRRNLEAGPSWLHLHLDPNMCFLCAGVQFCPPWNVNTYLPQKCFTVINMYSFVWIFLIYKFIRLRQIPKLLSYLMHWNFSCFNIAKVLMCLMLHARWKWINIRNVIFHRNSFPTTTTMKLAVYITSEMVQYHILRHTNYFQEHICFMHLAELTIFALLLATWIWNKKVVTTNYHRLHNFQYALYKIS